MTDPNCAPEPTDEPVGPPEDTGPLIYQAGELFRGRREIWIEQGDKMYRLRLTSRGSLYLTK